MKRGSLGILLPELLFTINAQKLCWLGHQLGWIGLILELEGFDRSFKSFHCHQPLILSLNPLCACNTITRSGAYLTHVMTILWRKSLSSQREMIAVIMSPYRFCWNSSGTEGIPGTPGTAGTAAWATLLPCITAGMAGIMGVPGMPALAFFKCDFQLVFFKVDEVSYTGKALSW